MDCDPSVRSCLVLSCTASCAQHVHRHSHCAMVTPCCLCCCWRCKLQQLCMHKHTYTFAGTYSTPRAAHMHLQPSFTQHTTLRVSQHTTTAQICPVTPSSCFDSVQRSAVLLEPFMKAGPRSVLACHGGTHPITENTLAAMLCSYSTQLGATGHTQHCQEHSTGATNML